MNDDCPMIWDKLRADIEKCWLKDHTLAYEAGDAVAMYVADKRRKEELKNLRVAQQVAAEKQKS